MNKALKIEENLSEGLALSYCNERFCLEYDLEASDDENEIKEQDIESWVSKITRSSKRNIFFTEQALTRKFSAEDPIVRKAIEVSLDNKSVSKAAIQVNIGKGSGFVEDLILWLCEIGVAGENINKNQRKLLIARMEEFEDLVKASWNIRTN